MPLSKSLGIFIHLVATKKEEVSSSVRASQGEPHICWLLRPTTQRPCHFFQPVNTNQLSCESFCQLKRRAQSITSCTKRHRIALETRSSWRYLQSSKQATEMLLLGTHGQ
ncbi:unnamed protein product [Orchesella dallaii]|uniref:Uncharacterized protein n=1 Tax=Orchesella dallaii TaxID=48710 RepID=A0ABP1PUZ9_9HEXA